MNDRTFTRGFLREDSSGMLKAFLTVCIVKSQPEDRRSKTPDKLNYGNGKGELLKSFTKTKKAGLLCLILSLTSISYIT